MISYEPFYRTLYKKNITEYQLIFKHGVSANTLHRIKHGQTITLKTLDTLCFILVCPVSDVIEYRREGEWKRQERFFVFSVCFFCKKGGPVAKLNIGSDLYK